MRAIWLFQRDFGVAEHLLVLRVSLLQGSVQRQRQMVFASVMFAGAEDRRTA